MLTFNFPNHTMTEAFPQSGIDVRFGGGYQFSTKPKGPDQITLSISFAAMIWKFDTLGVLSNTIDPDNNMLRLVQFYEAHRLHEKFIYQHPWRGDVIVRFASPLITPKSIKDGKGITEPFEIKLLTQP